MPELRETWTWKVLLLECPACSATVEYAAADDHASWHWLTDTEPKVVERG